jgi:beta-N-acetylhexosaminidase
MDDDRDAGAPGTGRRGVLKGLLAVGSAAPIAGLLSQTGAQAAPVQPNRAQASQERASLTSQQRAGQRVIYSYPGLTVPAALLQAIATGQAAGVIFFGGNISSQAQIRSAIAQLVRAQKKSPVPAPPLLMTDQEGGEVRRLPGAPVQSEAQIGASAEPDLAASQAGTAAGRNLAGVGMNVNLAPVLDVYDTPGNFIDEYQRSYSDKASVVTGCGKSFITAQQQTGVAATAKHFPGLGSATSSQDTDTGPVTLNVPLTELRSRDEAPYPTAIAAGVKLIMVSWAIYPALDAAHPAGLSPTVVQQELRGRLGYQGVLGARPGPGPDRHLGPGQRPRPRAAERGLVRRGRSARYRAAQSGALRLAASAPGGQN